MSLHCINKLIKVMQLLGSYTVPLLLESLSNSTHRRHTSPHSINSRLTIQRHNLLSTVMVPPSNLQTYLSWEAHTGSHIMGAHSLHLKLYERTQGLAYSTVDLRTSRTTVAMEWHCRAP